MKTTESKSLNTSKTASIVLKIKELTLLSRRDFRMFDVELAANIIFEAMEMFLDNRSSENIRIISF